MSEDEIIDRLRRIISVSNTAHFKNFKLMYQDVDAIEQLLDLYNNQKQQLTELQAIEEEHRKENGELRKELQSSVENSAELQRICRDTNMDDKEAILYLTHTSSDDFNLEKHQSENRIEAIKTIIYLYKQEKEKNKKLLNSKIGVDLSYDDYVSKDKIKAKIEEVKRKREEEWETAGISMLGSAIDVLIELLEEE